MRKLVAALALTTLAACTSVPVDLATAPHVPEERILDKSFMEESHGKVPVVISYDVLRDTGPRWLILSVDDSSVARIHTGEQVRGFVQEGRRVLSTSRDGKDLVRTSLTDVFISGQGNYSYRISQGIEDWSASLKPY